MTSAISTDRARYITLDIKYFYHVTPMGRYNYAHMLLKYTQEEIVKQCNLINSMSMAGSTWKSEK